jgi:alpha-L-arabinofuranosidase
VRESNTGALILKLVNNGDIPIEATIGLEGRFAFEPVATRTVLSGDPKEINTFEDPARLMPVSSELAVGESFSCDLPTYSLTVIRLSP